MREGSLSRMAQGNYRGVRIPDLVCLAMCYQQDLNEWESKYELKELLEQVITAINEGITNAQENTSVVFLQWLINYHKAELATYFDISEHCFYLRESIRYINEELDRRQRVNLDTTGNIHPFIIQTIKERLPIQDVVGWYHKVIYYGSKWTYLCSTHGDTHPSGTIDIDKGKWYCFGCSRGGDILDMVQICEGIELHEAIAKLARHLGLDLTLPKGEANAQNNRREDITDRLYR